LTLHNASQVAIFRHRNPTDAGKWLWSDSNNNGSSIVPILSKTCLFVHRPPSLFISFLAYRNTFVIAPGSLQFHIFSIKIFDFLKPAMPIILEGKSNGHNLTRVTAGATDCELYGTIFPGKAM
jgi:hypothetical protein